jgi:dephospho-CoA kinase
MGFRYMSQGKPLVIGITGKIATGKTYFCELFSQVFPGTSIFNADAEAKKLLEENKNLQAIIIKMLGTEILDPETHKISYKKLAEKIFTSDENYQAIVPEIWKETEKKLQKKLSSTSPNINIKKGRGVRFFLVESALLLEAGWGQYCDKIILLKPSKKMHQQYILAKNLSEEAIDQRLSFQSNTASTPPKNIIVVTEKIDRKFLKNRDFLSLLGTGEKSGNYNKNNLK